MMKQDTLNRPFFQGKVDNFCAGYAVLNAIKLLRNMSGLQARVVLNEMLYHESQNVDSWLKVLNHETDYNALVIRMLKVWEKVYNYNYFRPFEPENYGFDPKMFPHDTVRQNVDMSKPEISLEQVWDVFDKYTKNGQKTLVFRLCRFLPNSSGPVVDHWTTMGKITKDTMYFYDCSLEASGWYIVPKENIHIAPFYSIPAQTIALRAKFKVNLANKEFGMICPEHIHVLEALDN